MRARTASVLVVLAGVLVAADARADATLDDAAPALWLVAPIELGFFGGVAATAGDTCQGWGCGMLVALTTGGGLIVGIGTAIVGGVTGAHGDVPLVVHLATTGALSLGLGIGAAVSRQTLYSFLPVCSPTKLRKCTRWPERRDCDQACTRQI